MSRKTAEAKRDAQREAAQRRAEEQAAAFVRKRDRKAERLALLGGVLLFLALLMDNDVVFRSIVLLALLAGVAVMLRKRKTVARRFGLIAVMLIAYCVMLAVSSFYAPASKFALREVTKNLFPLALFLLALGLEPERGERSGRCCALIVELSSALASIFSIDFSAAKLLTPPLFRLVSPLTEFYLALGLKQDTRLGNLFGNVNIFSGVAGLGVLVALASLAATEDRRRRRFHLACLAVNATAFVCALSRGAMFAIVVAFAAYLLFERGEARVRMLVVMVETLIFAGAAAAVGIFTQFGSRAGCRFALLAATVIAAGALVAADELVGQKLVVRLGEHKKALTALGVSAAGVFALGCVLVFTLTGPLTLPAGERHLRAATLAPGEYTLHIEADGETSAHIQYVPELERFTGYGISVGEPVSDGGTFTVPEGARSIRFYLSAPEGATVYDVRYDGADSGALRLNYRLLPESVEQMLQAPFSGNSFMLRQMQWMTAVRLWKESPVIGLGVGSFENRGAGAMPFFYETKFVHCHYLQMLLDTGVIGLALFLGLLAACAFALLRAGKRETMHPMIPALGACLVFLALQAVTDVIFSSSYYLPLVYLVFALMSICASDALPVKCGEKAKKWLPRATLAFLSVWIVLLSINLYARSIFANPTLDGLETAAKLDWFERQDYMISYAVAITEADQRSEEVTRKTYAYLEKLEDASSNSVQYYVAECYFKLGEVEKAADQLARYTAYTANNRRNWNSAFALLSQYNDGRPEFIEGIRQLYQNLQTWNETALVPIELDGAVREYITMTLGI